MEILLGYPLLLGAIVLLMTGLGHLSRARIQRRARRKLASAPQLALESGEGRVFRITGRVRALETPLRAPLSGLPCVAYRSRAFELRQAMGTPFPTGQPIDYQTVRIQPFAIQRPEQRDVIIEATFAEFDLPFVKLRLDRATKFEFFAAHNVIATGGAGHFDEVIVADGDMVAIAGLLTGDVDPEDHDERGFRDGPPRRLQLVGNGPHPLVIGKAPS